MTEEITWEFDLPYLQSFPEGYRYKHGLPFEPILAKNIDALVQRIKMGKAVMIIIDGGVGEGKTTLAVHVADYINKDLVDLDVQLALGGEQFTGKLKICYERKEVVIIYDEAGDFNKRGALTKFNALLNRVFETFRAFRIIVITVIPDFNKLDNNLFDNKIPRLLLHLSNRKESYGHFRAYSLNNMLWLRWHMKKQVVKEAAFKRVQPNFYGWFLNLPPNRAKQLDSISTKGKIEVLGRTSRHLEGLYSYQEIAKKLSRSLNWTKNAIYRLGIAPTKTEKKIRYFDEHAMEVLMEEVIAAREKRALMLKDDD
jgi:hypothetical protein